MIMKILHLLLAITFAIAPLSIFIPQPVQASTQLIGTTVAGSGAGYAGEVQYQAFTATASGTINAIKVYSSNNGNIKVGIYNGTGTLIAANNTGTAVLADQWNTIMLTSSASIIAGTGYWLAHLSDTVGCITVRALPGTTVYYLARGYIFGLPATFSGVPKGLPTYEISIQGWNLVTLPAITTSAVTDNGYTAPNYLATLNGSINDVGGGNPDLRGFVWSTSTHGDPGNVAPVASAYSDNWTEAGSFIAEVFSHQITSFAGATEYFVRSCAHNVDGWAYGNEVTFTTLSAPTITTQAASMVSFTTARLNATVTVDGGQSTDVRFAYDNVTRANFALYANTTAWVEDTYATGGNPYADITSLTGATTYYFRVQVRNDVASAEGSELTFTTSNAVSKPTNISVIPASTSISLSWTKGSGALYTLARYKIGSYPTTNADGTSAYLGTGNSVSITGLTPGLTYYVSLWGFTGGTYSTDYATGLGTTLAYDAPGTGTGNAIEVPADTGTFTQTPSTVKVATVPFHEAVEAVSTAYGTPLNMVWYVIWMIAGLAGGIMLYNRAGQGGQASYNLPMTFGAEAIWFGIGAGIGLTMMWIVVLFLVVATGFTMFGNRH